MITILTSPDDISSVNRPVIWELQSNRYQPNAPIKSFTSVSSGGTNLLNIPITAHDYLINDIIQITESTLYNGKYKIFSVPDTNNFKIIKSFNTSQGGKVQLLNNNFQIVAEITSYNKNRLNISSISIDGIFTKITTSVPHDFKSLDRIFIEGTTDYNGFHKIYDIIGNNAFDIMQTFTTSQTGTVIKGEKLGSKIAKGINENGVDLFRFDVSNFLKAAVSFDLKALGQTDIKTPNDNVIAVYQISFKETWENETGLMNTPSDELLTTEKRVINSTLQHRETQNMNAFTIDNAAKRFLTNAQKEQRLIINLGSYTEELQFHFINNSNEIFKFRAQLFDLAGALIIDLILGTGMKLIGRHGILPINNGNNFVSAGVTANLFNVSAKVKLWLIDNAGLQKSEILTFIVDRNNYCDSIRLWWQNRLSGMDAYTFTSKVIKKQKSKKELFKRLLHKGFALQDRGMGILSTENILTYEVHSEFLTAEQMIWLSELISSPEVFMQEGTNFIPIVIDDADEIVQDTEELQQFKIKFIEANELITQ